MAGQKINWCWGPTVSTRLVSGEFPFRLGVSQHWADMLVGPGRHCPVQLHPEGSQLPPWGSGVHGTCYSCPNNIPHFWLFLFSLLLSPPVKGKANYGAEFSALSPSKIPMEKGAAEGLLVKLFVPMAQNFFWQVIYLLSPLFVCALSGGVKNPLAFPREDNHRGAQQLDTLAQGVHNTLSSQR